MIARASLVVALCLVPSLGIAQRRAPTSPERVCVPGAQVECPCVDGARGVQRCTLAGDGLGECLCPPVSLDTPRAAPATPSHASDGLERDDTRDRGMTTEEITRWYGWQTMISDAAAAALYGSALRSGSEATAYGGAVVWSLGTPILHWAHGNTMVGFVSLGVRAASGTLGAIAFGGGQSPLVMGSAVIAGLAMSVADAFFLANEVVGHRRVRVSSLAVDLRPLPGGAALGVAGVF